MTSIAIAPTGAAVGEFDAPTNWKRSDTVDIADWATSTRLRDVESTSIRDVLNMFDRALTATNSFLLFVGGRHASRTVELIFDRGDLSFDWLTEKAFGGISIDEYESEPLELDTDADQLEQRPAVTVVQRLVDLLGLPKRDLLRAAGISKSTFHTWDKPNGPRPRVASQGQLWALAEAVDDLAELLGGVGRVGQWILAHKQRRSLLREGEFDRLLDLASPAAVTDPSPYLAGLYAAGEEKLEPRASNASRPRTREIDSDDAFTRTGGTR